MRFEYYDLSIKVREVDVREVETLSKGADYLAGVLGVDGGGVESVEDGAAGEFPGVQGGGSAGFCIYDVYL